jgi:nucleotide-binding universal stress UspA family protein
MSGPIERVVVPLDAAGESLTAIDTAARLAAHAKAPLHGIFVEDEDLLHLARLPFARQSTLGALAEQLTTEHVELHLRIAAERARRELFAAAERHGVTCSFQIVRGASGSALSGASERDLVVACALTRPIAGHFRVECRLWPSIDAMPGPFLLACHAWSTSGSVVMLLRDRGLASVRLLEAASQMAEAEDAPLTVICPPAIAGAERFEQWIADRLAGHSVRLRVEVEPGEPAALRQRLGELDCRLLATTDGGERVREFVERFGCDILIVR